MRGLRTFINSIVWVEVFALSGLLLSGAALAWAEKGRYFGQDIFHYRIEHFDSLPAWFACSLLLMVINGFWMFRLSIVEGYLRTPRGNGWGEWGATLPVNPMRLFAVNLVAIPAMLVMFMVMRAFSW